MRLHVPCAIRNIKFLITFHFKHYLWLWVSRILHVCNFVLSSDNWTTVDMHKINKCPIKDKLSRLWHLDNFHLFLNWIKFMGSNYLSLKSALFYFHFSIACIFLNKCKSGIKFKLLHKPLLWRLRWRMLPELNYQLRGSSTRLKASICHSRSKGPNLAWKRQ